MPINIQYGFHAYLIPISFSERKKEEHEGGKKKLVEFRDEITEFPLRRPVPQGKGVARCDPDHY